MYVFYKNFNIIIISLIFSLSSFVCIIRFLSLNHARQEVCIKKECCFKVNKNKNKETWLKMA